MSNATLQVKNRAEARILRRRKAADLRFRLCALSALVLTTVFLVFFFTDIIGRGYKAFIQTKVKVVIDYNEDVVEMPVYAVSEEMERIISYSRIRIIPMELREDPTLMGKKVEEWVVADSEVDQYIKGKANKLRPAQIEIVDKLQAEGHLKTVFNIGFFTRGDSKLPEIAGIRAAVVGSVYVLIITFLVSFPIGVLSAVYLEEFAPDNMFTRIIEVNINNLAAIPSILYGLLGLAIFINIAEVPRSSAMVGGLTLSLMTLPVIIISTRVALKSVPDSIRHGALALGASKWQAVYQQVLPNALPGILTGTIIGMARAMGETAPLIIVGMIAFIPEAPDGVFEASTVLPAQIFTWASASLRAFAERTAAGILVLLSVLMLMNATAIWLRNKYEVRW